MSKVKDALVVVGRFVVAHKSEVAAGVSYLASLPLPTPYHQIASLVALGFSAIAGTKYGK
jgi:hypothetical protein